MSRESLEPVVKARPSDFTDIFTDYDLEPEQLEKWRKQIVNYKKGKAEVINIDDIDLKDASLIEDLKKFCGKALVEENNNYSIKCYDGYYDLFNFDFLIRISKDGKPNIFVVSDYHALLNSISDGKEEIESLLISVYDLLKDYDRKGLLTKNLKQLKKRMEKIFDEPQRTILDLLKYHQLSICCLKESVKIMIDPEMVRQNSYLNLNNESDIGKTLWFLNRDFERKYYKVCLLDSL